MAVKITTTNDESEHLMCNLCLVVEIISGMIQNDNYKTKSHTILLQIAFGNQYMKSSQTTFVQLQYSSFPLMMGT